jgi:hypothetical protein
MGGTSGSRRWDVILLQRQLWVSDGKIAGDKRPALWLYIPFYIPSRHSSITRKVLNFEPQAYELS